MTVDLDETYKPSEDEPFMCDRQREYFRRKLLAWKEDILHESRETLALLLFDPGIDLEEVVGLFFPHDEIVHPHDHLLLPFDLQLVPVRRVLDLLLDEAGGQEFAVATDLETLAADEVEPAIGVPIADVTRAQPDPESNK